MDFQTLKNNFSDAVERGVSGSQGLIYGIRSQDLKKLSEILADEEMANGSFSLDERLTGHLVEFAEKLSYLPFKNRIAADGVQPLKNLTPEEKRDLFLARRLIESHKDRAPI